MTRPTSHPPTTAPLPVPADHAVYLELSTDHYPWTDITADLALRQGQGLSGVFDAVQGERWARFVWTRGELLGGFTWGGQDVPWAAATLALPRARVTLTAQDPRVTQLLWSSRARPVQALAGAWPAPHPALVRDLFTGVLVGGGRGSYWEGGQVIAGSVPPSGAPCGTCTPYDDVSAEQLAEFWRALLAAVHRAAPLDSVWREVCARLCSTYVCLDPFAQEVTLRGGVLSLDPTLKAQEFRPALLAALRAALARLGVRLADLPLTELRARPEWAAAGLETV